MPATGEDDLEEHDDLSSEQSEDEDVDDESTAASDDEDDDDHDDDEEDDDDSEEETDVVAVPDEDSGEASLDELLDQRAAARRAGALPEDDTDIMSLSSEPDEPITETIVTRVDPPKERQEFVCRHCFLVKPRVQLADERRMYCRDCV